MRLINTSEAAEILGVTPQTITSLCRSGMIDTAFFVGGNWLIYWSDFLGANMPKIGRPAGSRNLKPYPKGVKRPRKHRHRTSFRPPDNRHGGLALAFTERLIEVNIEASVGSVGDSYDNALAETINGLYKTEVIWHRGP